jgi:hydroxymethylbilane synthase
MDIAATKKSLVIGTRASALALRQADIVSKALKTIDQSLTVEIRTITTRGDVNLNPIPVDTVGKGWFTKEIEQDLLDKKIDLAVHSLKDMAYDVPSGLSIGAYLPREDARDALITKHGQMLEELPAGAVIGTDSIRRQVQMRAMRPDLEVRSLRGNVLTRLEKLQSENYDAIILAAAGLKRLGLEEKIIHCFSPNEMTPAPGQGILAVQIRQNDLEMRKILASISDDEARWAAEAERSFSQKMGGGCKSPIGAYAFRENEDAVFMGMVTAKDNVRLLHHEARLLWSEKEKISEGFAEAMLEKMKEYER